MCGRTCCTLSSEALVLACQHVANHHQPHQALTVRWQDAASGNEYVCMRNAPPTSYLPVVAQAGQLGSRGGGWVMQPMLWGMVPFWHQSSSATDHGLSTNNARLEGLSTSKLYSRPLANNQRCVVVCDGFYEWKTLTSRGKQPYLVYASQQSKQHEDQLGLLDELPLESLWNEEDGWIGPKPLFMAGLFSSWSPADDSLKTVNSFSVITRKANATLDWLHDRMPAILATPHAVKAWLDPDLDGEDALTVLKPVRKGQISWHAVSTSVGNVRNQDKSIVKRVQVDKSGKPVSQEANSMAKWLKKRKPSESDDDNRPSKDQRKKKSA